MIPTPDMVSNPTVTATKNPRTPLKKMRKFGGSLGYLVEAAAEAQILDGFEDLACGHRRRARV